MKMKGAQMFVEALRAEGVEVIFGHPGGAVLPIFDALYDAPVRTILMRHEQAAAHAADGFARASGKVGVCLATSGPGATNLVTGIATAFMDSVPIVAFTGQVKSFLIGNDAFQEADTTGVTRPITKHNYLIRSVEEMPRVIKEAFYIARTGRPGPVLVDIPVDFTLKEGDFSYPETVHLRGYDPTIEGHIGQLKKAAKAIKESKKPLIYVGGGALSSGAEAELAEFQQKIRAPLTMTLMGLGVFPGDHPDSLGMLGMHGTVYTNNTVQACDLLIAIGARFDDRVTGKLDEFAPHAKIIHIDIDPAAISKNIVVDIPIVGDVRNCLRELNKLIEPGDTQAWLAQIAEWRKANPLIYPETEKLSAQYVIEELNNICDKDKTIFCSDVGQHQMWLAQFYRFRKPRSHITSGGLGTMGYGFPAAIGAKFAHPDATIVNLSGDGSFQMNLQELATCAGYDLDIKILIINNKYLGMVRQWQKLFYKGRYSCSFMGGSPDFVKLAEAYGFRGVRLDQKKDVRPILKDVLETPGTTIVDIVTEEEENVFPIVAPGEAINRMIVSMA